MDNGYGGSDDGHGNRGDMKKSCNLDERKGEKCGKKIGEKKEKRRKESS